MITDKNTVKGFTTYCRRVEWLNQTCSVYSNHIDSANIPNNTARSCSMIYIHDTLKSLRTCITHTNHTAYGPPRPDYCL